MAKILILFCLSKPLTMDGDQMFEARRTTERALIADRAWSNDTLIESEFVSP
jgi:hypothetical protein